MQRIWSGGWHCYSITVTVQPLEINVKLQPPLSPFVKGDMGVVPFSKGDFVKSPLRKGDRGGCLCH